MKIQTTFGTNINHIQQQRVATLPTASAPMQETSPVLESHEANKSALTHQLLSSNTTQGFLQALYQGIETLEEGATQLITLSKSDTTPNAQEAFTALLEKMMDVVDNSLYENHSLFHGTSSLSLPEGTATVPSFGFLETLERDDEDGLEEGLGRIQMARKQVEKALFVSEVTAFNTLAALSTYEPPVLEQGHDTHKGAHLKARVSALLKDA
ncbi:MAG: hypothetical protein IBX45_08220 [Campylobacterales bacterium]|nr:hypothetical protein [Campylobacterales bacterium]